LLQQRQLGDIRRLLRRASVHFTRFCYLPANKPVMAITGFRSRFGTLPVPWLRGDIMDIPSSIVLAIMVLAVLVLVALGWRRRWD
jgi:hypothetical protein